MLQISLLDMNSLNQTESAIFFSLVYCLLSNDLIIQNLFNIIKEIDKCDKHRFFYYYTASI